VGVALHLEQCLSSIFNAPNHHDLNLYRGSVRIVDLTHRRLKVLGFYGERNLTVVRVDEEEACLLDRAQVLAAEKDDDRLIGVVHLESSEHNEECHAAESTNDEEWPEFNNDRSSDDATDAS